MLQIHVVFDRKYYHLNYHSQNIMRITKIKCIEHALALMGEKVYFH